MNNSLFSTYSQGENRVTSSIIAVLERLNLSTLTYFFQIVFQETNLELISFSNQIKDTKKKSVPDARIKASFEFFIETKIVRDSLNKRQIESHLSHLSEVSKLILLTTDFQEPDVLKIYSDNSNVIWCNFNMIYDAIESILEDQKLMLTERERFLLGELNEFIVSEKLISEDFQKRVIVIPARRAIGTYRRHSVYICQPKRTFKEARYIAFYSENKIHTCIPRILGFVESINLAQDNIDTIELVAYDDNELLVREKLKELAKQITQGDGGEKNKIFILSDIEDSSTINLEQPIKNEIYSASGRRTAFVQNQRYIQSYEILLESKTTSELI